MLVSHIGLLKDELKAPKQKESTECDVEIVVCKVADANGEENSLADGMRQDTFNS